MTEPKTLPSWLIPAGIALTLLAAVIVGVATLAPAPSGPGTFPHIDKVMHFLGFFGIVLPISCAVPRRALLVVVLAIAYGGAIELIQPHVGRGAEWGDFAANSFGAVTAALLGRRLHDRFFRPTGSAR